MADFALLPPLAGITLTAVLIFGIVQIWRMRATRGRGRPSSLAADGDPHRRKTD